MHAAAFHRVLVGWDASPGAEAALDAALRLAGPSGRVVALAVLPATPHVETDGERESALAAARHRVEDRFDEQRAGLGRLETELRLDVLESQDQAAALREYAGRHGFDLVVVGRHGEGGILHPKLGHVSTAVVQSGPMPVLVVGQPGG
ncbi:MAG: universal stress protein [Streptosporangiales bacterium]